MIKYNTPQELFTAICNKIRSRTNSNELINHQDIPNEIDNLVDSDTIKEYNELLSLIIDNNITEINTDKIKKIYMSFESTPLAKVNLPECTSIGGYAFNSCNNLTTVNLPECTSIIGHAFDYCTNLATLILSSNQIANIPDSIDYVIFYNTRIANGTGYIYVPDNLVDSYKTATNWSTYANQFKPLSELPSNLKEEYGYE